MNQSGDVLGEVFERFDLSIDELLVVCDTLDLPVGEGRLKRSGSTGGHRGLQSISEHLESVRFMRCSIGIGRPTDTTVVDYVLSAPSQSETDLIQTVLERTKLAVSELSNRGIDAALQVYNTK